MVSPEEITKKVNEVIAKNVNTGTINLNKLIDGSSVNRLNASNALYFQEPVTFVKEFNDDDVAQIFIDTLEKNIKDIDKKYDNDNTR